MDGQFVAGIEQQHGRRRWRRVDDEGRDGRGEGVAAGSKVSEGERREVDQCRPLAGCTVQRCKKVSDRQGGQGGHGVGVEEERVAVVGPVVPEHRWALGRVSDHHATQSTLAPT